ncbi:MAG TPA: phosphoribosyltransferase [Verrucomicrobiae bacterium]
MFAQSEERYRDRRDAGRELANALRLYAHRDDVIVLALPRGGVPVAYEIARELQVSMDIFLVRKLGVPWHEELAMGAIATGGVRVLNEAVIRQLKISPEQIEAVAEEQQRELLRREEEYRGGHTPPDLHHKICILVDDGLATGASMRAAVEALKLHSPAKIIVAVPVGAPDTCSELKHQVDELVCGRTPGEFRAVGAWYRDFSQTTDEEVRNLLKDAGEWARERPDSSHISYMS